MKDSVELIKFFLDSLLSKRSSADAISCLSDDVLCIGTEPAEMRRGIASASAFIDDLIHDSEVPYRIVYHELEKTDTGSVSIVFAGMDIYSSLSKFSTYLRFSAAVRSEYGTLHISFFHMSIPSALNVSNRADSVLDNVPCGIGVYRMSSKGIEPLFMNRAVCRFFAIDMGRTVSNDNLDYSDQLHPDDRADLMKMLGRAMSSDSRLTDTFRIKKADGNYHWINLHMYTIRETDHSQILYVSYSDVDNIRLLETKQEFYDGLDYRKAISSDFAASMLVDITAGTVDDFNGHDPAVPFEKCNGQYDSYLALCSKSIPVAVMAEKFLSIFSRSNLQHELENGNTTVSFEYLSLRSSGSLVWTDCGITMINQSSSDHTIGFIHAKDITKEKINSQLLRSLINKQYDFTCIVNGCLDTFNVISVSDSFNDPIPMSGQNFEHRMSEYITRHSSGPDTGTMSEALKLANVRKALENNDTVSHFATVISDSGSMRYKKIQLISIDRETESFAITMEDCTDLQRSQLEHQELMLSALNAANAANKAKDEFLSNMSYEVRTPINSIIGLTDMMLDDTSLPADHFDRLTKIANSSKALLRLINRILDMSDIESGKISVCSEPFDLKSSMDELCQSISSQCQLNGVSFITDIQSDIPSELTGDSSKLRQVLLNLLDNAVKFTPRGGQIKLHISCPEHTDSSAKIRFLIEDTGIGMSSSFLPRAFMPFSQEYSSASSAYGGTGLGLAISKSIVNIMSGTISLTSEKSRGTSVTVDIPFDIPVTADDDIQEMKNASDRDFDFSGKHILIAEDNTLNVEILRYELSAKNAVTQFVPDGAEALKAFSSSPVGFFSVILMDIRMPKMDGITAASKIRALEKADSRTVPIIAMSAGSSDNDEKLAREAGMNTLLTKPVSSSALYYTLQKYMK